MKLLLSVLLLLASVAQTSVAFADLAPPPGYVDPCTVERQQGPGVQCEQCQTLRGTVDAQCAAQQSARGWQQRCTGGGATVGRAVFCSVATQTNNTPPSNTPPARSGCASCSVGHAGTASLRETLVFVFVGLLLARTRRARVRAPQ